MVELNFWGTPNLNHIFECWQCFRWNEQADESYIGVANGEVVRAYVDGDKVILDGTDDVEFWTHYFDCGFDYEGAKERFAQDGILKKCIDYGFGIRILRQDLFETIISFIISANNNIPRIKGIIERLCGENCAFPTAESIVDMGLEKLSTIGAGYRDKYIYKTAKVILNGDVDLDEIVKLPTSEARKELLKLHGVGPKVADCILLFGMSRFDVFPSDVWIKRILNDTYNCPPNKICEFAEEKFGEYRGLAQQYLFYYFRDNLKNIS